uniref:PspA/IM30 family protein n=1 Tax=Aeromonas caviae TaxID=648 RepID=UPI0020B107A8
MSIFSRLADIINSNLTALLDKAEDPQKMVRLIIQEMEDELVKERSNLARFLANQKEIGRQVNRHQERVAEWQGPALIHNWRRRRTTRGRSRWAAV